MAVIGAGGIGQSVIQAARISAAGRIVVIDTGLGTQAALVALPFQVYERTGSAFLTGLLGAAELGPIIAMSL